MNISRIKSLFIFLLITSSIIFASQFTMIVALNSMTTLREVSFNSEKFNGKTIIVKGYIACIVSSKDAKYILTDGVYVVELDGYINFHRWLRRKIEVTGIFNSKENKIHVLSITSAEGDQAPSIAETLHKSPLGKQMTYVIFVNFTDMSQSRSISDVMEIFSEAAIDYYKAVSYGLTWFEDTNVIGWLEMPRSMSYYAADNITTQQALARDAISIADPYIDFNTYYRIIIIHSGRNEAITGNESDIWSYAFMGEVLMATDEGNKWLSIAVVSEFDPLGVLAHEMGHMLGLPDLYDISGQEEFMGKWDLMAKGNWNGEPIGSTPAHPSSACKISLGWLSGNDIIEVDYGSTITVELNPIESSSGIRAIKIPVTEDVYYLIEARRKTGYDLYLPGEGVLILLVNETLKPGEGLVKLIDAKPETATLNDAYFRVGDSWINEKYKLSVWIEGEVGFSFKVKVTYEDKIIIDKVKVSGERVDVGSTQKVMFHAKWNSTGIDASEVKLELNGTIYVHTNASGWAVFQVTSDEVGKVKYTVTGAYVGTTSVLVIKKIDDPEIIWDKVIVELHVPADKLRVNVGSNATIICMGRYAYDNTAFKGEIYLNASTFWPYLGERWYTVKSIKDHKYNLTKFEANSVKVIYDSLGVEVLMERKLYNPGETFQLKVNLTYASDGKPVLGGKVQLDNLEAYTGADGGAIFTITAPSKIGTFIFAVKGITDGKSVTLPFNIETIKLTVTQIIIDEIKPVNVRVEVGRTVKVGVHAIWAHNFTPADGAIITVCGEEILIEEDGWGYINLRRDSITKLSINIEEVNAPSNIASFNQTVASYIIWDRIEISIESYTLAPGTITAIVRAIYVYDEQPIRNAIVRINDLRATESEPGVYSVTFEGWGIVYTIEAKLECEGFSLVIERVNVYAIGNIAFHILIVTIIGVIVFYFIKVRRGERIFTRIKMPMIK